MSESQKSRVIIIGAGPAGIAAAIQLCRCDCPPLLLEKERPGGLLWNANLVENYPGFPDGIPGPDLVRRCAMQLARVGGEIISDEALLLDQEGRDFLVETARARYRADLVLVASGTRAKPFPIPVPQAARGLVFDEIFPLLDLRGKHIALVGGGDAAFDYALNLSRNNRVSILNRNADSSCLPLLRTRAAGIRAIRYVPNCSLAKITPALSAAGRLQFECVREGERDYLEADALLFAIGREPQNDFISDRIRANQKTLTGTGRLLFAGDVVRGRYRQAAIAVGDGLLAAMRIVARLEDIK
ncbi:MAG: NAD(P)/FAD-dependent oxidoreductase [Anaerolineales bacterium]|nr:NAD(P)/FAD-dependent oxidoreductase [Anaerolineales bacterium]